MLSNLRGDAFCDAESNAMIPATLFKSERPAKDRDSFPGPDEPMEQLRIVGLGKHGFRVQPYTWSLSERRRIRTPIQVFAKTLNKGGMSPQTEQAIYGI